MPLCCNCIQTDTFWINAFFFFSSMISLSLVASQSVYTPKWSSAILKTNSLPTSCCLGKEPFRGNYRCADWCERLLIIFQLAPVSGCVCVCLFLNALTFPLLWLWFPGVSLFLASSLLFLRDSDCGWLCWPHPEAFCWKQIILSIKFRSLSVSGGCEWEWPWFAHLAVWKASFLFFFFFLESEFWVRNWWVLKGWKKEHRRLFELRQEHWGLGSRELEVIHTGFSASTVENTSSPKRCVLRQDMRRWLKGLKHLESVVLRNINVGSILRNMGFSSYCPCTTEANNRRSY